MNQRKITQHQLRTLLLLALLPLATELLPGRMQGAGSAAWLCPLLAGAAAAGLGLLAGRGNRAAPDLCRRVEGRWGKRAARVIALLLFLWGLFLLMAHASRVGGRLADALRASPMVLTAAVLLLAGWLAAEGAAAFARAGEIFALAVGFGFGLILLFGVFRLRWDYIILWERSELAQVPGGALAVLGTLGVGCYALVLLGDVREEPRAGRRWLPWLAALFGLTAAGVVLVLGRFGPALTGEIQRPFFQMVSGLGFEGAFQRLEQLASALWILGDEALLGLLVLSLRRLLAFAFGVEERRRLGWYLLALVFVGTLASGFWNGVMDGAVLPVGNLIVGGVMVLLWGWKKKMDFFQKSA